jgi:GTPase SAR1 family protein
MLKLKENVNGFVYDSIYGTIVEVCTEYVDVENIVLNDDDYVFVYNENVNDLFDISSKEDLENDEEGLSKVIEWVD